MTTTDRPSQPDISANPGDRPETLTDFLQSRAVSTTPCVLEDEASVSWAELLDKSRSVASGLVELGIGPGDRVAIWLPNRLAWLVTFFACAQLGAIAVSVNTRFRSAEVGDLLYRSASKVLCFWPGFKDIDFAGILGQCSSEALSRLQSIVLYSEENRTLPTTVVGKPTKPYVDLLALPPLHKAFGKPHSLCAIFTTSGTTKAPKLVAHCQRNVLSHAFNVARQYGLDRNSRFLLYPPFCGVYGFCSALAALAAETPLILAPTWNPVLFADLIERHGVTHMTGSNEAVGQLLDARPEGGRVFPSLEFIGFANLNPAMADIAVRSEQRGVEVVGLFGSSEMQALFSLSDCHASPDIRTRAGGIPASPLARLRARDPQTDQICKPGDVGELEFFAPESRFVEYFGDPAATANAFTSDGYFRSGDLGSVEADGSFVFLARMGDTLRLGGFLVSPAEIEELIQQHPTIESCQIVGVKYQGALRPIAFVIARKGESVKERDIIDYAAERLAKYKVPAKVFVVDEFPTTPSANGAKIQKNKLREMAEARLGPRQG